MKKILVSMLVLALCAPAMADVTVTGVDQGGGVLRITVSPSGGDTVRGVGLLLGLDAANTGDGVVASATVSGLNTNIDYLATNGTGGVAGETPAGEGHPLADPAGPGVATVASADVSLCSGYLDPSGGQAGLAVDSFFDITYTLTSDTLVTIDLDTLRGGIVGDIAGAVTIATPTVLLEVDGGTCRDLLDPTAQALYDRYVAAGKDPSCWCYQYQCRGDADGAEEGFFIKYRIYNVDLAAIVNSFQKTPESGADPCADFDHAEEGFFIKYSVYNADLALIVANFQTSTAQQAAIGDCPTYLP